MGVLAQPAPPHMPVLFSTLTFFSGAVDRMSQSIEPPINEKTLIEVRNLKKYFPIKSGILQRTRGWVKAVDDVSFVIQEGETLGLVGESGCG